MFKLVIDIKAEIDECKRQGMPDFMIEEHILDLIAELEDGEND